MSVTEPNQVDAIGIDRDSGQVTLAISDHLEWDDPDPTHSEFLKSKIGAYIRYIQGGQILADHADARERGCRIDLFLLHPPDFGAVQLLREIVESLGKLGIDFTYGTLPEGEESEL
jgi:hypothetical protein